MERFINVLNCFVVMNIENKLDKFQKELGLWFKHADEGRVLVTRLYEKGKDIKEKIESLCPEFWDRENYIDLKEALKFIDELHDNETIEYHSEDKREIYYHRKRLLNI
jgi:50S ribosomal subunit-associated GTPase HflX